MADWIAPVVILGLFCRGLFVWWLRLRLDLPVLFLLVSAGMLIGLALALLPGLLSDLAPSAPVHIPAD